MTAPNASGRVGALPHPRNLWLASLGAMLEYYGQTLSELREAGYLAYARRQLSPYVRACIEQFSAHRRTLTQRVLERASRRKRVPPPAPQ